MRVPKALLVVLLLLSLCLNFFLYKKTDSQRAQMKIGDKTFSKKLYNDWLQRRYGREFARDLVRDELIQQGAKKAGFKPDEKQIDKDLQLVMDVRPDQAVQLAQRPWIAQQARENTETAQAMQYLQTKDVPASDTDLRGFYAKHPGAWDTPTRIYTKAFLTSNQSDAEATKELLEKVKDIGVIRQQMRGKAGMVGADGTWMFQVPVGQPVKNAMLADFLAHQSGYTKVVRLNAKQWVVARLDKVETGSKASYESVKDKVALAYKMTRAKPAQEVLQQLWADADMQFEDPSLKDDVKRQLFPDQIGVQKTAMR